MGIYYTPGFPVDFYSRTRRMRKREKERETPLLPQFLLIHFFFLQNQYAKCVLIYVLPNDPREGFTIYVMAHLADGFLVYSGHR